MTRAERIASHKQRIEDIKEEIEWLEATQFWIKSLHDNGTTSTAELVARQRENIRMYEGFIARLEEGAPDA